MLGCHLPTQDATCSPIPPTHPHITSTCKCTSITLGPTKTAFLHLHQFIFTSLARTLFVSFLWEECSVQLQQLGSVFARWQSWRHHIFIQPNPTAGPQLTDAWCETKLSTCFQFTLIVFFLATIFSSFRTDVSNDIHSTLKSMMWILFWHPHLEWMDKLGLRFIHKAHFRVITSINICLLYKLFTIKSFVQVVLLFSLKSRRHLSKASAGSKILSASKFFQGKRFFFHTGNWVFESLM